MKLVRYGPPGHEMPGLVDAEGHIRDISSVIADVGGAGLAPASLERLRTIDPDSLPLAAEGARLGPCVAWVGKIMGIGLNYSDHAAEAGMPVPEQPILFMKATSAITGPNDDIIIPKNSQKTDYEVELAVVIGQRCQHVAEADALSVVAGYCIVNDVSERAFQIERGGQWSKGKSADSFCPIGPWLVTADEVPDPQNLAMRLSVNGQERQNGTTATMVFGVAHLISHLSEFMTLEPGDVIPTGTPPGVAMGMKPPQWLKPGDEVRLSIVGLGEQVSRCRAYAPAGEGG